MKFILFFLFFKLFRFLDQTNITISIPIYEAYLQDLRFGNQSDKFARFQTASENFYSKMKYFIDGNIRIYPDNFVIYFLSYFFQAWKSVYDEQSNQDLAVEQMQNYSLLNQKFIMNRVNQLNATLYLKCNFKAKYYDTYMIYMQDTGTISFNEQQVEIDSNDYFDYSNQFQYILLFTQQNVFFPIKTSAAIKSIYFQKGSLIQIDKIDAKTGTIIPDEKGKYLKLRISFKFIKYNFNYYYSCAKIIDKGNNQYDMEFRNQVWENGVQETEFFQISNDLTTVICNVNETGIYGVYKTCVNQYKEPESSTSLMKIFQEYNFPRIFGKIFQAIIILDILMLICYIFIQLQKKYYINNYSQWEYWNKNQYKIKHVKRQLRIGDFIVYDDLMIYQGWLDYKKNIYTPTSQAEIELLQSQTESIKSMLKQTQISIISKREIMRILKREMLTRLENEEFTFYELFLIRFYLAEFYQKYQDGIINKHRIDTDVFYFQQKDDQQHQQQEEKTVKSPTDFYKKQILMVLSDGDEDKSLERSQDSVKDNLSNDDFDFEQAEMMNENEQKQRMQEMKELEQQKKEEYESSFFIQFQDHAKNMVKDVIQFANSIKEKKEKEEELQKAKLEEKKKIQEEGQKKNRRNSIESLNEELENSIQSNKKSQGQQEDVVKYDRNKQLLKNLKEKRKYQQFLKDFDKKDNVSNQILIYDFIDSLQYYNYTPESENNYFLVKSVNYEQDILIEQIKKISLYRLIFRQFHIITKENRLYMIFGEIFLMCYVMYVVFYQEETIKNKNFKGWYLEKQYFQQVEYSFYSLIVYIMGESYIMYLINFNQTIMLKFSVFFFFFYMHYAFGIIIMNEFQEYFQKNYLYAMAYCYAFQVAIWQIYNIILKTLFIKLCQVLQYSRILKILIDMSQRSYKTLTDLYGE